MLGIAALPTFLLKAVAIERGTLVPLLVDHAMPERGLHVVRPPGEPPAKVRALTISAARFGPEPYWDPYARCTRQAGPASGRLYSLGERSSERISVVTRFRLGGLGNREKTGDGPCRTVSSDGTS